MTTTTDIRITLLDFPIVQPDGYGSISPFVARVRYILNYKQLPFMTEWVDYPDIESVSKKYGLKPTGQRSDGSPRYTVPAILDETSAGRPVAISNSIPIIQYLESTYPTPDRPIFPSLPNSTIPAPAIHLLAETYIRQCVNLPMRTLSAPYIYHLHKETVRDRWLFIRTGVKSIEDVTPKKDSEEYKLMWEEMKTGYESLAGFFDQNSSGAWIMGDKPTFIDFVILSYLMVAKLASPDDLWAEVKGLAGGRWEKYVRDGEPFMALK